jgi:NADH-quinone oxidoreductase subunit A
MLTRMLQPYVPLLILIVFVVANAILMLGVSHILSSYRRTPTKIAPYESGMPVLGDARERFSVKFYLVAMLFIIFDIETVFMIPWAVAFRQLGSMAGLLIVEMLVFMLILAVGYVYLWKRGALQWDCVIRQPVTMTPRPSLRSRRTGSPPGSIS